jgi:hypothetical protein
MGTLPPALFNAGMESLPFARMVELTIDGRTVGGGGELELIEDQYVLNRPDYGPCPMFGLPMFADDGKFPDETWGTVWNASSVTGAPPQLFLRAAPWDGPRRIKFWDTVSYDYTRTIDGNSLAGSGPAVKPSISEGIITITAPEDRPLPYVTWLTLRAAPVLISGGENPTKGYFTEYVHQGLSNYEDEFFSANLPGVNIGIVRHEFQSDLANYKLVAVEENAINFLNAFIPELGTPKQISSSGTASIWGFDVVPPNTTFQVYAGWSCLTRNDWAIQNLSSTMFFTRYGYDFGSNSVWTETPPTVDDDLGTRTYFPINRFGVMTF